MKRILLLIAMTLAVIAVPVLETSCAAPSERVVQVQTLKAVGHTADGAVALSAQLYRDGRITAAQARQVMDFYDQKFQPAFRLAVNAVQANLDSLASPEVANLASQLSALVLQFQNNH